MEWGDISGECNMLTEILIRFCYFSFSNRKGVETGRKVHQESWCTRAGTGHPNKSVQGSREL